MNYIENINKVSVLYRIEESNAACEDSQLEEFETDLIKQAISHYQKELLHTKRAMDF